MMGTRRLALATTLGLALVLLPVVPGSALCADVNSAMALGPFPADAPTTIPLFHGLEGPGGSFNVRWTGFACGLPLRVNAEYSDAPGSAAEGTDYLLPQGGRTPDVCELGCPEGTEATISFPTVNDSDDTEAVAEAFTVALSNPVGGILDPPSSAPFVIVDDDGTTSRVAFDELPYSQSETKDTLAVPVWRAGPADTQVQVPYSVGPGPENAATINEDYTVTSPNPLVFGPNDRVELITLSIVNDHVAESEEKVTLHLPGGVAPNAKTVTIQDREGDPPTSRLLHPRHRWRYKKSDHRIREVHILAHDNPGGSGVTAAQLALRRNMKNGDCQWLIKSGWKKGACRKREWLPTEWDPVEELWHSRPKQLKSSVGTRINSYTAFSRAIDVAGNVEKDFKKKRNANTFEVKGRTRAR